MGTPSPDIAPGLASGATYTDNSPRTAQRGTEMLARERWQIRTIIVLENVFEERLRQVAKYGHNEELEDGTGPKSQWLPTSISAHHELTAETIEQELRFDYEEHERQHGKPTWMHLIREEIAEAFAETDDDRLEEELTQVAALCVSWIEKIRARRSEEAIV